jgi:hypothetical protein
LRRFKKSPVNPRSRRMAVVVFPLPAAPRITSIPAVVFEIIFSCSGVGATEESTRITKESSTGVYRVHSREEWRKQSKNVQTRKRSTAVPVLHHNFRGWTIPFQTVEMSHMISQLNLAKNWLCLLLAGALNLAATEKPVDRTLPVRGFCIAAPASNRVDEFIKFIGEELAQRSVNVLILRVDYGSNSAADPRWRTRAGFQRSRRKKSPPPASSIAFGSFHSSICWGISRGNPTAASCSRCIPNSMKRPR